MFLNNSKKPQGIHTGMTSFQLKVRALLSGLLCYFARFNRADAFLRLIQFCSKGKPPAKSDLSKNISTASSSVSPRFSNKSSTASLFVGFTDM